MKTKKPNETLLFAGVMVGALALIAGPAIVDSMTAPVPQAPELQAWLDARKVEKREVPHSTQSSKVDRNLALQKDLGCFKRRDELKQIVLHGNLIAAMSAAQQFELCTPLWEEMADHFGYQL